MACDDQNIGTHKCEFLAYSLEVSAIMMDDGGGNNGDTLEVIRNPVLAFMHAWFMGDDANSIMRNAVSSFTIDQLEEATRILRTRFPICGGYSKHRTSDKFVNDIMAGFKVLNDSNLKVEYVCSSVEMRKVKASTILFSEDEPVVAVQMRDMKKEISDLKEAHQTILKLLDERLPEKSPVQLQPAGNSTFANAVTKSKGNISLSVPKPFSRDPHLQPQRKRANSELEDAYETIDDDTDLKASSPHPSEKDASVRVYLIVLRLSFEPIYS